MFKTIKNAWSLPDLRKKILFTLLIIVVFRIGSVIQVPFLDTAALRSVMNPDDWSNTMLSYMNTLSGGAFSNATLFAMGITPYINSSIIIQLLCVAIPPLERLAREGEAGRRKISAITRYVTVGLGIIQGTAYYFYLLNSKVTLYNRSEEHTSELQSHLNLVCRLLLEKKKQKGLLLHDTSLPYLLTRIPY